MLRCLSFLPLEHAEWGKRTNAEAADGKDKWVVMLPAQLKALNRARKVGRYVDVSCESTGPMT